jgi:hypothetical protein
MLQLQIHSQLRLQQLAKMGVVKHTNNHFIIWANNHTKLAASVSVTFAEAMERLSHDVD